MSVFHTHFLLPLVERERHAGLPARLRAIRKFERMPEQLQREEHQSRLRRILQHAYDTVPFHRQRFDEAGFRPADARIDRPLPLPVLGRDHLRQQASELLSSAFHPSMLRVSATGGTTSTPAHFYRDLEGLRDKTALNLQLNSWAGFETGDKVMTLWGAHRDLAMNPSWRWRFYEEGLLRRTPAPSGFITEDILERFRKRYEEARPKVLYAYTNVLLAFAAYVKEHGLRHRPQVLIVTAELLSEPSRKLIESVFGVPLFNHYGSRDVGMIASECQEHDGLHFHPWGSHVEFEPIGEVSKGSPYRLIVTDLLNYGQPFIRYDTGDCVTLADHGCRCGRSFPLIKEVLGRVADGIILANGGIVPGTAIATRMGQIKFNAISQVQFIQKSHQHIHLRYVALNGVASASEELESICSHIDLLTKHKLHWTLEQLPEIPREPSGKVRLCLSEVAPSNQNFEERLQNVDH